ncbi:ABC transporter ATP-binding protein [Chitinilyticum litopenaei]|uniref:ABC transporter ATP-binding protein n=1 Tax=Chitinilyticum litopenaei TaxID=1121276 RepID=UPI000401BFF1|nr:ABC transporter ATP-binding protein [Chitinilyticum litopenaei]
MGTIVVNQLNKCFTIYRGRLAKILALCGINVPGRAYHKQVLRNISFRVAPGEALAIVGRNGSGKSTLLKLICRTLAPTSGLVSLEGRVSALLELGVGFHEELTGRQNAYISGQLLGFSRDEIHEHIDGMMAFSELGEYFDVPIKKYSSGMQMRLAFSVATAIRPDILIVDEALSVGDAYFQHKCFDRIKDYRQKGTTLLFVSHDPLAIKSICNRAILLDRGDMVRDGDPGEVLDYYNALISERDNAQIKIVSEEGVRSGTGDAEITQVVLQNASGQSAEVLQSNAPARLLVSYRLNRVVDDLTVGMLIKDRVGNEVFGTNSFIKGVALPAGGQGADHVVAFDIAALALGAGTYNLSVALHSSYHHLNDNYDWWDHACTFTVLSDEVFAGVARLETTVSRIS